MLFSFNIIIIYAGSIDESVKQFSHEKMSLSQKHHSRQQAQFKILKSGDVILFCPQTRARTHFY